LRRAGYPKGLDEPPLAFAHRLAERLPDRAAGLLAVSQRYSDWRYRDEALTDDEQRELVRALRGFRITPAIDRS
jgi:hypothetical protein